MTKKELLYPVKIKKSEINLGENGQWYLYQKSDRQVLVNYKTKDEAKAAKEIHDWIRKELLKHLTKERVRKGKI